MASDLGYLTYLVRFYWRDPDSLGGDAAGLVHRVLDHFLAHTLAIARRDRHPGRHQHDRAITVGNAAGGIILGIAVSRLRIAVCRIGPGRGIIVGIGARRALPVCATAIVGEVILAGTRCGPATSALSIAAPGVTAPTAAPATVPTVRLCLPAMRLPATPPTSPPITAPPTPLSPRGGGSRRSQRSRSS